MIRLVVVVAVALCLQASSPALAEEPFPRALPMKKVCNKNKEKIIELRTSTQIPDDGELNWKLSVPDNFTVTNVALRLQGLYHDTAADLQGTLLHEDRTATFLDQEGGEKSFGTVRHPSLFEAIGEYFPVMPVEGDGFDYEWMDVVHDNIAPLGTAYQQTTINGGDANRAIDGNTNGFYSADSVTHTGSASVVADGPSDSESWWELDLGQQQPVGTIRVWNRVQEPNVDEVQEIRVTAATLVKGGTFRLSVTIGDNTAVTAPISVFAVAKASDEDPSPTAPAGAGAGESLEAKLEGVPFLPAVTVTDMGRSTKAEQVWRVTFSSEPSDITVLAPQDIDINAVHAAVQVKTLREGNNNPWYNYKEVVDEVELRLFPFWVFLLEVPLNDSSVEVAKDMAVWKQRASKPARQTLFNIPPGRNGRYIRIQLEDQEYLTLAEVEVYEARQPTIGNYPGGSPIAPATYQSKQSLADQFYGVNAFGDWLLQLRDVARAIVTDLHSSFPRALQHGFGGLSTWALVLTDEHGQDHIYHADVSMKIGTLPVYGTLHYYNATSGTAGSLVPPDPYRLSYQLPCIDHDCSYQWDVGYPSGGASRPEGSRALWRNRVTAEENEFKVVYRPNRDWVGEDFLTYSVFQGTAESTEATLSVHTRKCRLNRCENDLFDDIALRKIV